MTNEVMLAGRLSRDPQSKVLPSGDVVWSIRLVVPRDAEGGGPVDWFDCSVWSGRLFRTVQTWGKDDQVEVRGSLRRRFFRVGGQPVSRVEMEASGGRIIRRAAPA